MRGAEHMGSRRSAVFLGNMNAMPMAYALDLRERGWDVTYFVDSRATDKLPRPELKFPSIGYPYPSWIVERPCAVLSAAISPRFLIRNRGAARGAESCSCQGVPVPGTVLEP